MKTNSFTKRFTKKLKSNTGASMLLALAFFLMCFFVASVVMASASVNASRALAQKEEQRSYFAIQSAEDLIKGMFKEINGVSRTDNMQEIPLQAATDDDGLPVYDDAGNPVYVCATTYGGFHLRQEITTYEWCEEGRKIQIFGKKQYDSGSIALLDVLTEQPGPEDIDYSQTDFGLDCIGNEDNVVFKNAIEEVTSLALCKRLYNQGEKSLTGYGKFSNYFSIVDKDFNLLNNPDYTYYFDLTPSASAGKHEQNIPTVHVKMTADNNANLYFELTVDSRFASTYSASIKAKATIDTMSPMNSLLKYPVIGKEICEIESAKAGKTAFHHVTQSVSDTYVAWYAENIEITKGVSAEGSGASGESDS